MRVPPAVKICGLTRPHDARQAEALGAAYLGVILAGGPRLVTLEQAARVLGPPRAAVGRVAVFGAQAEDTVARVRDALALDALQLHGEPDPEVVARLRAGGMAEPWPVVRVAGEELPVRAWELAEAAGVLVLDTLVAGQQGGTGIPFDWHALSGPIAALRRATPGVRIVAGGGLRPENVAVMARLLAPEVVDVSSGVEGVPGVKDPVRMARFLEQARAS